MRLTKFMQSCVLVENAPHTAVFDPDNFTWNAQIFPLDNLQKLDYILITHIHSDHYSPDFVKVLMAKFPSAKVFSTQEVADDLKQQGIANAVTVSDADITVADAPHEDMQPLLAHPNDQNVVITLDNKVTHPGDSFQISQTADLLLLPIDGPWGSTADAAKLLEKVKPRYVLPIHDAMYTDLWRGMSYDWIAGVCERVGSNFLRPELGKPLEVNL